MVSEHCERLGLYLKKVKKHGMAFLLEKVLKLMCIISIVIV
jgi:hypothetical protein